MILKMKQFESFQTPDGEVVIVNKSTITYIKPEKNYSRIFFNCKSVNGTLLSVQVDCPIEEVEKILNCD